jgi:hypothetical protein
VKKFELCRTAIIIAIIAVGGAGIPTDALARGGGQGGGGSAFAGGHFGGMAGRHFGGAVRARHFGGRAVHQRFGRRLGSTVRVLRR